MTTENKGIPEQMVASSVMPVEDAAKRNDPKGIPYAFGNRRDRREIVQKLGKKENMKKQVHLNRHQLREAMFAAQS